MFLNFNGTILSAYTLVNTRKHILIFNQEICEIYYYNNFYLNSNMYYIQ